MEPTAGLVVIGDEILRGQVVDTNTFHLATNLRAVGVKLCRVVVVPDIVNEIAEEVRAASRRYSMVFTSGGVGPTHDDVTYSAVAKGLGLILEEREDLVNIFARLFPGQQAARRLATVPSPCELVYVPSSGGNDSLTTVYPIVKAENVYILPGSPKYFTDAVATIIPQLQGSTPSHMQSIDIPHDELSIVNILDELVATWVGQVSIGSYPQPGPSPITRITLEGGRDAVEKAMEGLLGAVRSNKMVVNGTGSDLFSWEQAQAVVASSENQPHIKTSLNILQQCYEEHCGDEVFLSFNGGKDCTAVLHLAAAFTKLKGISPPICLYVTGDPFPEVEEFVQQATLFYGLETVRKERPIKSALEALLVERKNLKAGLMGVRRGDPGSAGLQLFAPTDPGWPQMVRVNPILDWSYNQVWQFLLEHKVPYCSLYDKGYTSLGAKTTTSPNPLLRDPNDPSSYLPAHTLTDGSAERQGRS